MPPKPIQQRVSELLEELEPLLGLMESADEEYVEDCLQREMEAVDFTSRDVDRLNRIYEGIYE